MSRTTKPFEDTDNIPFSNNLKLSITHSIVEIQMPPPLSMKCITVGIYALTVSCTVSARKPLTLGLKN